MHDDSKQGNAIPTVSPWSACLAPAFVALCKASSKLGQHYLALLPSTKECPTRAQLPVSTLMWCVVAAFGCGIVRYYALRVDESEKVREFEQVLDSLKFNKPSTITRDGSVSTTDSESDNDNLNSGRITEANTVTASTKSSSSCCNLAVYQSWNKMMRVIRDQRSYTLKGIYASAMILNSPGVVGDFCATYIGVLKVFGGGKEELYEPKVTHNICALVVAAVASYNFLTFRYLKIPAGLQSFSQHVSSFSWRKMLPMMFIVGTVAAYLCLNILFNNKAPAEMYLLVNNSFPVLGLPVDGAQVVTAFFNVASYPQMLLSVANGAAAFDYTFSLISLVFRMAFQSPSNILSLALIGVDAFVFAVLMWNTISCALPSSVISATLAAASTLCVTATYLFYNLKSSLGPLHKIVKYNADNKENKSLLANGRRSGIRIKGVSKAYRNLWWTSKEGDENGSLEEFKLAHSSAIGALTSA